MKHLWKVVYDCEFSSSSTDGGAYTITDKSLSAYVATDDDTLACVREELNLSLGIQTRLTSIESATYLGIIKNL